MPVVRRTITEVREDTQEFTYRLSPTRDGVRQSVCSQSISFTVLDYYVTRPLEQYAPPEVLGTEKPPALVVSMSQDPENPVGWFMRPGVANLIEETSCRQITFSIGTWRAGFGANVPNVQTESNSYPCASTTYPYTQPLVFYYTIRYPRWEYRYSKVGTTEYYDQIDLDFKLKLTVLPFVETDWTESGTFTYKTAGGTNIAKINNTILFPDTELKLNASNNWRATLGTVSSTSERTLRNLIFTVDTSYRLSYVVEGVGSGGGFDSTNGGGHRWVWPYLKYSTNQVILNYRTFHGNTQVPLVAIYDYDYTGNIFDPYNFKHQMDFVGVTLSNDTYSSTKTQLLQGKVTYTVGAPTYEIPNYPNSFRITSKARTNLNNATYLGVYTLLPTTASGRDLKKSFPIYYNHATDATISAQGGYQLFSDAPWISGSEHIAPHSYLQLGPIWNDPTTGIELIFDKIPKISTGQIFNFIVGKYSEAYIRADEFGNSWTVVDGNSLLAGLALDRNGKLFGVPTKTTNTSIEIRISNSVGSSTANIQLIVTDQKRAQLQGNDLFKATLFEGLSKAPALLYGKPASYKALSELPKTLSMSENSGTITGSMTAYPSLVEPPDVWGTVYVDRLNDEYTSKWEFSKIPESTLPLNPWNIVKGTDLIGVKFAGGNWNPSYRRNSDGSLEVLQGWMRIPKGSSSSEPMRTYALWVQVQNDSILLSQYSKNTGRRMRMLSVENGKLVVRASVYDPRWNAVDPYSVDDAVDYSTKQRSHVVENLELLNRWVFIVYMINNDNVQLFINGQFAAQLTPRLPGVPKAAMTNFSTYTTDGREDLFYPHDEYAHDATGGKIAFFASTVDYTWSEREIINVYLRTHPTKSYPNVGSKKYVLIGAASSSGSLSFNDSREPIFFEGVPPAPSYITVSKTDFGEGLPITIKHIASCRQCLAYEVGITITGWKVKNLPTGLNFNATTGEITGALSCRISLNGWSETTTYSYQITAENAQGSYTQEVQLSVYPRPVVGPSEVTLTGKVGEPLWQQWMLVPGIETNPNQRPVATGGWNISEQLNTNYQAGEKCGHPCGNLPGFISSMNEGLCFSNCGVLSGAPEKILNDYTIQIKVKNDIEHWSAPVTAKLNISAGSPVFLLAEGTEYLVRGAVDFIQQISLSNPLNRPVTSWSATDLPPGLSISSTGLITGKPSTTITNGALYRSTITATGPGGSSSLTLNFKVQSSLTDDSTLQLYWGDPLPPIKVAAGGLIGVNAWDTEGLPTGLVFNKTTLELSGTPTWDPSYGGWDPWNGGAAKAKLTPKTLTQVPAVIKDIGYGCGVLRIAFSDTKLYIDPVPAGINITSPWVAPGGETITGAAGNNYFICVSTTAQTHWFLKSGQPALSADFPTRGNFIQGTGQPFHADMLSYFYVDERYIRYARDFYGWNPAWDKKSSQVRYSSHSDKLAEQGAMSLGGGAAFHMYQTPGGVWTWKKVGPSPVTPTYADYMNRLCARRNSDMQAMLTAIKAGNFSCYLTFRYAGKSNGDVGDETFWNQNHTPTNNTSIILDGGGVWDTNVRKMAYTAYANHLYMPTYSSDLPRHVCENAWADVKPKRGNYLSTLPIRNLIYLSDNGQKIAFVDIFGNINIYGGTTGQIFLDLPVYNCGYATPCNNTKNGTSIYREGTSLTARTPTKVNINETPQWVNGDVFYRTYNGSQARMLTSGDNVFYDSVTVVGQPIDVTFKLNHGKPVVPPRKNLQVVVGESAYWGHEYLDWRYRKPTTWAATGLPAGLTINTTSGIITGTLTAPLPAPVTVQLTIANQAGSATWPITVSTVERVNLVQLKYPDRAPSDWDNRIYMEGQWGEPWTAQFTKLTVPGWGNLTWSMSEYSSILPGVPGGLSINTVTGIISGTPTDFTRMEEANPGQGIHYDRPLYNYVNISVYRTEADGTTLAGHGCILEIFIKPGKPKILNTWDRKISFNLEGGDQTFNLVPLYADSGWRPISSITFKNSATGADVAADEWKRTYGTDIATHIGKRRSTAIVANPVYPLNVTPPDNPHKFILTAAGPGGSVAVEVFVHINPIIEVAAAPKLSGVLPTDSLGRELGPCAGVVKEGSNTPGASAMPVNYAYYWFGFRLAELHKASTSPAVLASNLDWLDARYSSMGCGKAEVVEVELVLGEETTFSFLPYWFFVAMSPVKQTTGTYNGTYSPQALASISGWPIPLRRAAGAIPSGMGLNMWWLAGTPITEGEFKFSLTVDTEKYNWLYKNIQLYLDSGKDTGAPWSSLGVTLGTYWSRVAHRHYGSASQPLYPKLSIRPTLIRSAVNNPRSSSPKTYWTPRPMAFDLPWIETGSNSGQFITSAAGSTWPVGDFKKADLSKLSYTQVKYPVESWNNPHPFPSFTNLGNTQAVSAQLWLNDYDKHFPYAMANSLYAAEQSKENAAQQAFSSVITESGSPLSTNFKTPEVLIRVVALPKIPVSASIQILLNRETDINVPLEYESVRTKLTFFSIDFGSTVASPKLQVDKFGKITGKTQDLAMLTQASKIRTVTIKAMISGIERTVSSQLTINYAYPPPLLIATTLYGAKEEDFFGAVDLFDADYGMATFWEIVSGSLPAGLKLDPDRGYIAGIPEVHGIFTCTITATGPGGDGNIVTLTLGIAKSIKRIQPGQKMTLKGGSPFSFTLATIGGEPDDYLTVANDSPSLGSSAPRAASGGILSMQELITSWHKPNSNPSILAGTPYFTTKTLNFGNLPDASALITRASSQFNYTWAPVSLLGTRYITYNLASKIASSTLDKLTWLKLEQSVASFPTRAVLGFYPQEAVSVGGFSVVVGDTTHQQGSTFTSNLLAWTKDGRTWSAQTTGATGWTTLLALTPYAGVALPGTKTMLLFCGGGETTGHVDFNPTSPVVSIAFKGYHLPITSTTSWRPRSSPITVKMANKSFIAIIAEQTGPGVQVSLQLYKDLSSGSISQTVISSLFTKRTILLFDTSQAVSKTSTLSQWLDIWTYLGGASGQTPSNDVWITALASNDTEVIPLGQTPTPRKLVAIGTKPAALHNSVLTRAPIKPVVGGKALLVTYDRLLITTAVRETSIESEKAIHTALVQLNPNFAAPVTTGIGAGESIAIKNKNAGNPWYNTAPSSGTLRVDLNITEPASKIIAGSVSVKGYIDGPAATARFNGIHGVVEDQSGNLYVTDRYNNKIRKISNWRGAAATVSTFASLEDPKSITLNSFGEFFVTAKHAVYKISATGVVTLWIGNPNESGYVIANGTAARLNDPQGIVAVTEETRMPPPDGWGQPEGPLTWTGSIDIRTGIHSETYKNFTTIYFLDSGNQRLRQFYNYPNSPVTSLSHVSGGYIKIRTGGDMVCDKLTGNIYVCTHLDNSIYKITPNGIMSFLAGSGTILQDSDYADGQGTAARFVNPTGITVGSDGNIYVVSNDKRLSKITPGGQVTTVPLTSGLSVGTPYGFVGLVRDSSGNFFTAGESGYAIYKIATTGRVTIHAGGGSPGFVNGSGSAAKFNGINSIAIDGANNLYVGDFSNNRIRKITPSGNVTTLLGPSAAGHPLQPGGVTALSDGTLFIADKFNHGIYRLAAGSTSATIYAGGGGSAFGNGFKGYFSHVSSLSMSPTGDKLYVLDQNGTMIRMVYPNPYSPSKASGTGTLEGACTNCTDQEFKVPNCTALTYGYEWWSQYYGRLVLYAGGNNSAQAETFKVYKRDTENNRTSSINFDPYSLGESSWSYESGFGGENHKILGLFHAPRTERDPRTGISQLYATTQTGEILKLQINDTWTAAGLDGARSTKVSYLLPGELGSTVAGGRDWAYLYDTAVTPQNLDPSLAWPFTLPEKIALPATSYDNRWAYLAYGAGKFIAIQDYSSEATIKDTDEFGEMSGAGKGAWSEDGRVWTPFDLPNTPRGYSLGSISFINNTFFLIMQRVRANASYGAYLENKRARVLTSVDGTTWELDSPFYVKMAFRNLGAIGKYQDVALRVDYGPPKPLAIEKLFLEAGKNYADTLLSFEDSSFRPVTSWKITGLPAGLTYAEFAPGQIFGKVDSPGNYVATLELFNSVGSVKSAISIVITPISPVITPGQSFTVLAGDYQGPAGEVVSPTGQFTQTNFSISPQLARTYPGQTITWKTAAISPTEVFPTGITIDSSTGKISGKLSKIGTYILRIAAVSEGAPQKSELITLVVVPGIPVILPGQVWKYTAGTLLNYTDPNIAVRLTDPANMMTSFSFKIADVQSDLTDTGYQADVSDYVISENGTQTVHGRTLPKGSIIKGKYLSRACATCPATGGYVTTENEATEIELTLQIQVGAFSLYESAKIIWTYGPPIIAPGQEIWGEVGVPMLARPVQKTETTYTVGPPTFAAGKKNFSGEIFLTAPGVATRPTPAEYFRTRSEIIRNSYDLSTKKYVSGTSQQSLPLRDSGLEVGLRYYGDLKFPTLQYWGAFTGTPNTVLNTTIPLIVGNYAGERQADVKLIILGGQPRIKADQKFTAFVGEATEIVIATEERVDRPVTAISLYVGYENPDTFPTPDASPGTVNLNGLALVIESGLIKLKGIPTGALADSRIVLRAVGQNTYSEAIQASSAFGKLGWGSIKLEIFNNLPRARTDIVYTVEAGTPADIKLQEDPSYGPACLWKLTSAGQDLSLINGNLRGTIRTVGTYIYTVKAATCSGYYGPATDVSVHAVLAKPELLANQKVLATQQAAVGYTLQLTRPRAVLGELAWSSENLPAGLSLNSNGVIVGSVETFGKFTASVTVSNTAGTHTAVINFEIAPGRVLFTIPDMQMWEGEDFNTTLTVSRGSATRWWVGASSFKTFLLPAGIALSEAGTISGKPSSLGVYFPKIFAKGVEGSEYFVTAKITVLSRISIGKNQVFQGVVGVPLAFQVFYLNKSNLTITAFTASGLPQGLSMNVTGGITGTPTEAGLKAVEITITTADLEIKETITIHIIAGKPALPEVLEYTGKVGEALNIEILPENAAERPVTAWAILDLPNYLTSNNNIITGTPKFKATISATVRAANFAGITSRSIKITITDGVPIVPLGQNVPVYTGINSFVVADDTVNRSVTLWQVSDLPAGIALASTTGQISGTLESDATIHVTAIGPGGTSATTPVSLLKISNLVNVFKYVENNVAIYVDSFESFTAINYSIGSYALPKTLALNSSTGHITGFTSTALPSFVRLEITRENGNIETHNTAIVPIDAPPKIETGQTRHYLLGKTVNDPTLIFTGVGVTFSSLNLPEGLHIDQSSGKFYGTPAKTGTFKSTIAAQNVGGEDLEEITFVIEADFLPPMLTPYESTITLRRNSYIQPVFVQNTGGPIEQWQVSELPEGLVFNSAAREFKGKPATLGEHSISITATNALGSSSVILNLNILTEIKRPVIQSGLVFTLYKDTAWIDKIVLLEGEATRFSALDALPVGLILNAATGEISGNAASIGTHTIAVTAENAEFFSEPVTLTIQILSNRASLVPRIIPNQNFDFYTGETNDITIELDSTQGAADLWEIAIGSLPQGLTLDSNTGKIYGSVSVAGIYELSMQAKNKNGVSVPTNITISVVLSLKAPVLAENQNFQIIQNTEALISLVSINEPTMWGLVPGEALPIALSISTSTGAITGKPEVLGTHIFKVYARNTYGYSEQNIQITVVPQAPELVENQEVQGVVGAALSYAVKLFKGEATTWSYTGSLPASISLNNSGVMIGTPTESFSGAITVTASNITGSSSKTLKLTILNSLKLELEPNQRFYAKAGTPFNATIKYSGIIPEYWENLNALPAGLSLNKATGNISGNPITAGTTATNIKISHTSYPPYTAGITIDVLSANAALRIVASQIFSYATSSVFKFTPAVIGSPTTWEAKGLPTGTVINRLTGEISGSVATSGNYSFTIIVRTGASAATGTIKLKII